jgi:hypothetical protein
VSHCAIYLTARTFCASDKILCDHKNTVAGSFIKSLAYFKIKFLKILKNIKFS